MVHSADSADIAAGVGPWRPPKPLRPAAGPPFPTDALGPLAGFVEQGVEFAAVEHEEVVIVSSNRPRRLPDRGEIVAFDSRNLFWKQSLLDLTRLVEVALLLFKPQVLQARGDVVRRRRQKEGVVLVELYFRKLAAQSQKSRQFSLAAHGREQDRA